MAGVSLHSIEWPRLVVIVVVVVIAAAAASAGLFFIHLLRKAGANDVGSQTTQRRS